MNNNKNSILKIFSITQTLITFIGLFLPSACEKSEEAKEKLFNPITITSIELSKSSVDTLETITVTIHATDKEGRTLNYDFSTNRGDFSNMELTNKTANWTAPSTGGKCTITGRAYAGDDDDSASIDVNVLDGTKPVIASVYPIEGNHVPAVNHQGFSFNAYHPNGVYETTGLVINIYIGDVLNNSIKNNVQRTNPSGDNKNFTFTFNLDFDGISGGCRLEYKVRSLISNVDSNLKTVNFTVEGVSQDY
jgi:hypothetical protein